MSRCLDGPARGQVSVNRCFGADGRPFAKSRVATARLRTLIAALVPTLLPLASGAIAFFCRAVSRRRRACGCPI